MRLRLANIAVVALGVAVAAVPSAATAATVNAQAKASVVKPLTLRSIQNLDLGVVVLSSGTWTGATISLSPAGSLTCPATVTCSGATQVAIYNIAGSNGQTATINAPDVTLSNQLDSSKTITLVVHGPDSVTFTNSGNAGTDFPLGGSISVDSTTADGDYVGTFQVTAEYQ